MSFTPSLACRGTFDGLNEDDMKSLFHSLDTTGTLSEEKIVNAYIDKTRSEAPSNIIEFVNQRKAMGKVNLTAEQINKMIVKHFQESDEGRKYVRDKAVTNSPTFLLARLCILLLLYLRAMLQWQYLKSTKSS